MSISIKRVEAWRNETFEKDLHPQNRIQIREGRDMNTIIETSICTKSMKCERNSRLRRREGQERRERAGGKRARRRTKPPA